MVPKHPGGGSAVINTLREGKVFEPDTIEFVIKNSKKQSIITAGAYIGDFLPAFSPNFKMVYAFEPIFKNYEYARQNIALNNLKNVNLTNICLSNRNDDIIMREYGGRSAVKGIRPEIDVRRPEVVAKSTTLDAHMSGIADPISIIQLDAEGHEDSILEGSTEIIRKNLPIIITENKPAKCYNKYLQNMNYIYHDNKLHDNYVLYIKNIHNFRLTS